MDAGDSQSSTEICPNFETPFPSERGTKKWRDHNRRRPADCGFEREAEDAAERETLESLVASYNAELHINSMPELHIKNLNSQDELSQECLQCLTAEDWVQNLEIISSKNPASDLENIKRLHPASTSTIPQVEHDISNPKISELVILSDDHSSKTADKSHRRQAKLGEGGVNSACHVKDL